MDHPGLILNSVITCPACGHEKEEIMLTDACQYFYKCEECKTVLKPLAGDCCVFCSYGNINAHRFSREPAAANLCWTHYNNATGKYYEARQRALGKHLSNKTTG